MLLHRCPSTRRYEVSSVVVDAPAAGSASESRPFGLVRELALRVGAVLGFSALLGGILFYVWNPFAAVFTFLNPIHGYWTCTLVALGAIAVVYIVKSAWSGNLFDLDNLHKDPEGVLEQAVKMAVPPGALLMVAWLIVEYIQ